MNRRTVLLGVTLSLGCDEPDPRGPTGVAEVLVSATDWVPVDPIEDPFADRPATFACPEPTRTVEYLNGEPALEVVTGACEYLAVGQPSLVDIEPGDRIDLRIWHFDLTAPEPAEAHVAVVVGDTVPWERVVEVPSAAGLITTSWIADEPVPIGTLIQHHLHNHGVNAWALFELTRTIPPFEGP